jgi:hypothetical protein
MPVRQRGTVGRFDLLDARDFRALLLAKYTPIDQSVT